MRDSWNRRGGWLGQGPALLLLGVIAGALGVVSVLASAATGAAARADFDTCVSLALRHSPYFSRSALEIEVRRLDEKDSKSDYLPTITLRTKFYPHQPERAGAVNQRDYSLDVAIESYNPLVAHYSLKMRQLLTRLAVLSHLRVISDGLRQMGTAFLELEALSRLAGVQERLLEVSRRQETYVRRLAELGEATPLEVRVALQEGEVVRGEMARLQAAQTRLKARLRDFVGLKAEEPRDFDLAQGRQQVLRPGEPRDWTRQEPRSLEARMEAIKKELQSWNITLAKLRLLPGLTAAVQTPDPVAVTGVRGYFVSVGLTWPIFDGFKRLRDISRQKTLLAQAEAEGAAQESDFRSRWREAVDKLQAAAATRELARSQVELARIKERQAELRFQGGEPLSLALAAQRSRLEAEAQLIARELEHDQALLEVRALAGELVTPYVSEKNWLP
ncbi:MAG: TolC family protein [Syntrophobacterales bacterium]|nr:TolC family protein [Syntrophobacterales bacterium]